MNIAEIKRGEVKCKSALIPKFSFGLEHPTRILTMNPVLVKTRRWRQCVLSAIICIYVSISDIHSICGFPTVPLRTLSRPHFHFCLINSNHYIS